MRLSRGRRRSLGGWGVFCCAFLAMVIYVAFDLMDLDGSDLTSRFLRKAVAADCSQAEAESFLVQDPASPGALGLGAFPSVIQVAPDPARTNPRSGPATFTSRPSWLPPCAQARRGISSATSSTDDPA